MLAEGRRRRWAGLGVVVLGLVFAWDANRGVAREVELELSIPTTTPADVSVSILDEAGTLWLHRRQRVELSPLVSTASVPPGAYRIVLEGPGLEAHEGRFEAPAEGRVRVRLSPRRGLAAP